MTTAAVELGRHLVYDQRMSINQKQSCATCHKQELAFTTGLYNIPGTISYPRSNTGLYRHTGRTDDIGKFRVPTLRNIAVTAPYMHDGSVATLEAAIDHCAAGGRTITDGPNRGVGKNNPNKASNLQGFNLTSEEKRDLIAFLESLTDSQFLSDPRFGNPWKP
jgi:cytochrome c peroxidase